MTAAGWPDLQLRQLAAAVPHGVMLVQDGCVVWANERLAEMSGRGASLDGLKVSDLLRDIEDGIPRPGAPAAVECSLCRPDGELRTVICRRAWEERDGGPGGWVVEDVTHTRVLERELLRASQELALSNRELASARERLKHERAEREELLSVVSHELRTPVTVIGGYNRLLLAGEVGPLNEEQRRFLQESGKSCQRLDDFIGNLLEASRVSRGDEVLELGTGPVAPVVESVAAMFRPLLEEHRFTLVLDLDPEARARFDRLRVEQILTNLVGNAVKYARPGGTIEVAARALPEPSEPGERRFVEIAVSDDGPGVAAQDRERIFEAYVQAGEESRAGGLGLGLAICRSLVESHGGRIDVGEADAGGARFTFTLPAVGAIAQAEPGEGVRA
jgi:signal transduction histidine kinase